jgi:hypothetical protein
LNHLKISRKAKTQETQNMQQQYDNNTCLSSEKEIVIRDVVKMLMEMAELRDESDASSVGELTERTLRLDANAATNSFAERTRTKRTNPRRNHTPSTGVVNGPLPYPKVCATPSATCYDSREFCGDVAFGIVVMNNPVRREPMVLVASAITIATRAGSWTAETDIQIIK